MSSINCVRISCDKLCRPHFCTNFHKDFVKSTLVIVYAGFHAFLNSAFLDYKIPFFVNSISARHRQKKHTSR